MAPRLDRAKQSLIGLGPAQVGTLGVSADTLVADTFATTAMASMSW